jgi:hypothetical protein
MNEKYLMIGLLLIACLLPGQSQDIKLGAVHFPQAYIHAGTEYAQGYYEVVLTTKDNVPVFIVYDSKQELLFEELAIVQAHPGRKISSPFRLKTEFLKGEEYFRVMVIRPGQSLQGYFLVKK